MKSVAANVDRILDALDQAGVAHALIGATARNAWAPPRLTTDIDVAVVVDTEAYTRLEEALARAGYQATASHKADPADPLPAVTIFQDTTQAEPRLQLDILVAGTDFEREAVQRAVERQLGHRRVRVVTREDLIMFKAIAWRARDRQDIHDVLVTASMAGVTLDEPYLRRWARIWDVEARLEAALTAASDEAP